MSDYTLTDGKGTAVRESTGPNQAYVDVDVSGLSGATLTSGHAIIVQNGTDDPEKASLSTLKTYLDSLGGGSSVAIDAAGPLTNRDDYDAEAAGFVYLDTDDADLYVRVGGSGWSSAIPVQGPAGPPGPFGPDAIAGTILYAEVGTITLDLVASYDYDITTLKIKTSAGTVTAALKINGTNVTGISAVSASTTLATGTATAAYSVVAGDTLELVLSSASGLAHVMFSIAIQRV